MNLNQNFQLFQREYPLWKTYSEEQLREAMIEFCRKHNILTTSDSAKFLYGRLLSHIPIPPLKQNRQSTYKPPQQQVSPPQNQSHPVIPPTYPGTIPPLTNDPLQSLQQQSVTKLNQSLQEFMQQTKKDIKSKSTIPISKTKKSTRSRSNASKSNATILKVNFILFFMKNKKRLHHYKNVIFFRRSYLVSSFLYYHFFLVFIP